MEIIIGFGLNVSNKRSCPPYDVITAFVCMDYNLSPLDYVGKTTTHPINISSLDFYPLTNGNHVHKYSHNIIFSSWSQSIHG